MAAGDGGTATPGLRHPIGAVPPSCPPRFDPQPAAADAPPLGDPAAGRPLAAAWELRPAPGHTLSFTGLVDEAGTAYWTEGALDSSAVEVVSATRDGAIRFRVPGPRGPLALAGASLVAVANEDGACLGLGNPAAAGLSATSGAPLWRRELLPAIAGWLRQPGPCRYGAVAGFAISGARLLVAVSVLDHDSGEHESGYLALDVGTGDVLWTSRTSPAGNVFMSGAPSFADDGTGYGSHTLDYRQDELLAFVAGSPPAALAAPAGPWHGAVVAVHGPLLVTSATGGSSWEGDPRGLEVRCRADGALLAGAGSFTGQPLLSGSAAWFFGDRLARLDVASGGLLWQVALGVPPGPGGPGRYPRPVLFRSPPLVTAAGSVLFTEQQGTAGAISSEQELFRPWLREIDGDGREVLRRELPLELEAYQGGGVALQGGRLYLGGQVLPSAGAAGVLRAFDLPGEDAGRGWVVPEGSLRRDQRPR